MRNRSLIQPGYPCDTCGLTAEDNEQSHIKCEFCGEIGCSSCIEQHLVVEHADQIYGADHTVFLDPIDDDENDY